MRFVQSLALIVLFALGGVFGQLLTRHLAATLIVGACAALVATLELTISERLRLHLHEARASTSVWATRWASETQALQRALREVVSAAERRLDLDCGAATIVDRAKSLARALRERP